MELVVQLDNNFTADDVVTGLIDLNLASSNDKGLRIKVINNLNKLYYRKEIGMIKAGRGRIAAIYTKDSSKRLPEGNKVKKQEPQPSSSQYEEVPFWFIQQEGQ